MKIVKVQENGRCVPPEYLCFATRDDDGKNVAFLVEIWRARLKRDPKIVEGCVICLSQSAEHYVSFKWPVEDQLPTLTGLAGTIDQGLAQQLIKAVLKYRRRQKEMKGTKWNSQ